MKHLVSDQSNNLLSKAHYKTIQPLLDSGHIQAAVKGEYKYPASVVLLPGLSCMFKCTFCGRNYDAKEKRQEKHFKIFEQVILQDKKRSNMYISGGLEPMTNPYLNDIIKLLHDNEYKPRMLSNGFMLTPKYVDKNPYLKTLDHLRISIYGIDEEEYKITTRHLKGWNVVKENIKAYNKRTDKTNISINYVLLPTNFERFHEILNYIDEVGGVKELSLREDFTGKQNISDRNKFKDLLFSFDEKVKQRGIKVDYGYTMAEILDGRDDCKLIQCNLEHLDNMQHPQVKIYIDPRGDIYNYTGASFIDRPDSERHILGNVIDSSVEKELKKQKRIEPQESDIQFLDAFAKLIEYSKWSFRNESIISSTK